MTTLRDEARDLIETGLDEYVGSVPTSELAQSCLDLKRMRAQLLRAEMLLELRCVEEAVLYYEAPDGTTWMMQTDREREIGQPVALLDELEDSIHSREGTALLKIKMLRAYKHVWTEDGQKTVKWDNGVLNAISNLDKECAAIIRSHRTWNYGRSRWQQQDVMRDYPPKPTPPEDE